MRRQTLKIALLVAAGLSFPCLAMAQPMMGGGGMPDLRRIVGKALPDAGMPAGTLSVRVARKMPVNAVTGAEVSAVIRNAGGDLRKRTATTDSGGRALFEGLAPGDSAKVTVKVDGEELSSDELTMPAAGGLKTMLIAGLGAATGGGDSSGGEEAPASDGQSEGSRFMLGATSGSASPDPTLAVGALEVRAFDEAGAPIANHAVVLGMVGKENKVEVKKATTDASGVARFSGLPTGEGTGYAAVVDWHGMRLGTTPFAMPKEGGARAEIRALARTNDPKVITIGANARIVVFMHEDRLVIRELLPLENVSDKMFDPTPGAVEIPLPRGHVAAEVIESERKVEVRKEHGIAVYGPIPPRSAVLTVPDRPNGNEVEFLFALPYESDTREIEQPMPTGMGPFTLIIQVVEGHDIQVTGPGVSARQERSLNGKNYWVMGVEGVPAGGTLKFTLHGLPSTDASGRNVAGVLALVLIVGAIGLSWRRAGGPAGVSKAAADDERSRLIDRREALFSSLVALEQEARAAGTPVAAERRKQLVTELEQVYRRLAAQDEQRAA